MSTRRTALVLITPELVEMLLTAGHEIAYPVRCTHGLPVGAKLIDVRCNVSSQTGLSDQPNCEGAEWICLEFEHESFAEVGERADPPTITPRFEYQHKQTEEAA